VSDATRIEPQASLHGALRVPGDKSASHRALMISSLASGASTIEGLSPGQDVRATGVIMQQLGATIGQVGDTTFVDGPDEGLRASDAQLDCANSGTTMRLLSGLVSGVEGLHHLVGDPSLSKRPMDRVATPLRLMGASVSGAGERETAPLLIRGSRALRAIDYHVPTPSAQVKSAILFAGLGASGDTTVREDVRTRTATEDMFAKSGIDVRSMAEGTGRVVVLTPGRPLATEWRIPGDPSQAAFFCVLGAIHPDAEIEILNVDGAPERTGFVAVLQRMGAELSREKKRDGSSLLSRSSELHATEIHAHEIPSVDEVPVLAVAAAAASGVSAFLDMGELRVKESDRFAGALTLARSVGCRAWSEGDDFFIEGLGGARRFVEFTIDAGLDHRIVMAAAVAGAAGGGCTILGADTVASSYPHFLRDLASLR
jgi:3-phosphoshikimate 1-carboxyvinyltransferase